MYQLTLEVCRRIRSLLLSKLGRNFNISPHRSRSKQARKLHSQFASLQRSRTSRPLHLAKPISNTSATITKDRSPQKPYNNLSPQRHSAAAKPLTQPPSPRKYHPAGSLSPRQHRCFVSQFPPAGTVSLFRLQSGQLNRREINCNGTCDQLPRCRSITDAGRTRHTPGACLKLSAVPSARMGQCK